VSKKLIALLLVTITAVVNAGAEANPVADARRLLEASNLAHHYRVMTERQTRAIIRSYEVIISRRAEASLPARLRRDIAACYARVYNWEIFQPGLTELIASKLSSHQMRLLTDFYNSRGLPPAEIDNFKTVIAMAGEIEAAAANFMFNHSEGCVERDARLILAFLRDDLGML